MTFRAVEEVHISASVNEEDKFIAQASGQHVVRDTDLGEVPAILSAPPGDTLVNQPNMYSAQKIDLDGIPMDEVVVLELLAFSAPDASLDSRPIAPSELAQHSTSVEHSPGPRYPMPDDKSGRRVCFYDSQTVSDLLVDLRADRGGNPVPKPAPSELGK